SIPFIIENRHDLRFTALAFFPSAGSVPSEWYLKMGVIHVSPSSSTTAKTSIALMDFSFSSSTSTYLLKCAKLVDACRIPPVVAKVSTNTSTSGLSPDVAALTDAVKALLLKNTTPPPASVKVVEESCVTCGGPHPYYQCLDTDDNASGYQDNLQEYVSAAAVNYNQGNAGHHPPSVAHLVRPPGFSPVQNNQKWGNNYNPGNFTYRAPNQPTQAAPSNELANYMKVNDTSMRAMQN
ncbi:hypothetical protein Tco_1096369, partial [Tanacetum coccineum]